MRVRRLLAWLAWLVLTPVVLALLLAAGLWWWTGSGDSLAASLSRAARYLPAGQTLEATDVTGSLRAGGRIGLLRWSADGLVVEARDVSFGWQPMALLDRQLRIEQLRVGQLTVDDRRPAAPTEPLTRLVLPVGVDLGFQVDRFEWKGATPLTATSLAGRYRYDHIRHALDLDSAALAAGRYAGRATLGAQAPMALDARLQGELQAPLPGAQGTLPVRATATVQGTLAGASATLDIDARLAPAEASPSPTQALRASVTARLMPWAPQPLMQADARFARLDLALLWPQAPHTLLDGQVQVQPAGADAVRWQAQADLRNAAAGPWDRQRLPLQTARGRGRYGPEGWTVDSLQATLAGGQLELSGSARTAGSPPAKASTATAAPPSAAASAASSSAASAQASSAGPAITAWEGTARLRQINPAGLDTRLAAAALDGTVEARAAGRGVSFDARLQPSATQPPASTLRGLRLKDGAARGRWEQGRLSLDTLRLATSDAVLLGEKLELQPAVRAGSGQLRLDAPGLQATAAGRLAANDGAGDLSLEVKNAAAASQWLAQWPGAQALTGALAVEGEGRLTARWQGGWQAQGRNLHLQARLAVPRADLRQSGKPAGEALRLRELTAALDGPLTGMRLQAAGRAERGSQRVRLQLDATGGSTASGGWQARLMQAAAQVQDSFRPGTWTVQLRAPVDLSWQAGLLQAGAGEAAIGGPVPGTATVAWQPLSWRSSGGAAGRAALRTQGRISGLPLGWVELLGDTQLANLGLVGDMVFDGGWDLQTEGGLRLQASLQRRSGDLRVQTDSGTQINAGVREASLRLTSDGESLRAALRWDSENAGQVTAELGTRVVASASGWQWPQDAPLSGSVRAQLPRVGVWSVLAPPGWRMRGTLDARATLSGTRNAPHWTGTLQADELAIRSVVEGIEFSGGRLRATLSGLRLGIDEFSLHGAPVGAAAVGAAPAGTARAGAGAGAAGGANASGPASGGLLTISGFVAWLPGAPADAGIAQRLQMELGARAEALRVSARADRRLTVSGALQARLVDTRIELRGNLRADQALIILPDETTPTLGNDVVVRSSVPRAGAAPAAEGGRGGVRVQPDVAITLALGNDFRVQGRGVNTRLAGTLNLHTTAGAVAAPRLTGEVRAVAGTYRAYGQYLNIEEGVLRFSGPFDNPSLDVLAIRPNLSQRVGVQITGTALAPRVRLYSSPELPDAEKLAWLVLGRAAAAGGAESAVLQQAAIALLGSRGGAPAGGFAQAFGLDELSFRGSATAADGTTSAAAVTLGKRFSRDFYVAYERSLAGTLGTFYFFYDLSRRFTLRAQTGEQSAVDLIFTLPYE